MATGIDVFFTGLMLICLDGQPNCPVGGYKNTAWAVKANGPRKVCGWYSTEETTLELKFVEDDFKGPWPDSCRKVKNEKGQYEIICPLSSEQVCLLPNPKAANPPPPKLEGLPRLDEIDRRLLAPDKELLENYDYVSTRIQFPTGEISAGDKWPIEGNPTRWYRSDGDTDASFPRELSDRLKVAYVKATELTLTDCSKDLIKLTPEKDNADVVIRNVSKYPPVPDYDDEGIYESLAYLLWYYRLGSWDTQTDHCPNYTRAKKDSVILRCVSKKETGCVYDPSAATDTRFWPPMVGSYPKK